MKYLFVISLLLLTAACQGPQGAIGATGSPGVGQPGPVTPGVSQPPVPPNLDTINDVVQEYNENRVAQGQDPVTAGLACTLYTVPGTTSQIIGASLTTVGSWTYEGVFNVPNGPSSPGVNILPAPLQGIYTSYYCIKCTGLYVIPMSGWYAFDLSSDDGSNLYMNGLLINNDGTHAIQEKSATKFFSRGMVSFELDYFDIGGSHALMLMSGGLPIPATNFYH